MTVFWAHAEEASRLNEAKKKSQNLFIDKVRECIPDGFWRRRFDTLLFFADGADFFAFLVYIIGLYSMDMVIATSDYCAQFRNNTIMYDW